MAREKPLDGYNDTELLEMLDEAKDTATNLRFQHATGQLDNSNLLAASRRQVARLLTELRSREISVAEAAMARQGAPVGESTPEVESAETDRAAADPPARPRVFKRRRRDG